MLSADSGVCKTPQDQAKRYYYDEERGTCRTFIYSGCAGNQNNFVSYESCIEFCSKCTMVFINKEINTCINVQCT